MSDTPAIRIVQARIMERLQTITGYTISEDRPTADAHEAGELPAINVRIVSVTFAPPLDPNQDALRWAAKVQFDLIAANGQGEALDFANQIAAAKVMAKIQEDWTFGGRIFEWIELNLSGSELDGADAGCAILECEAHFLAPRTDPFKIIAINGAILTD